MTLLLYLHQVTRLAGLDRIASIVHQASYRIEPWRLTRNGGTTNAMQTSNPLIHSNSLGELHYNPHNMLGILGYAR